MKIEELLGRMRRSSKCVVLPPKGLPQIADRRIQMPSDLKRFYELCGGVECYGETDYGFKVIPPDEVVLSNPAVLGKYYQENKSECDNDISSRWYMLAKGTNLPQVLVVIDCDPERCGICYEGFWDIYATEDAKIVAVSFTDFLERIFREKGREFYWTLRGFDLGNAYDSTGGESKVFG